jgi:hypothetical protein
MRGTVLALVLSDDFSARSHAIAVRMTSDRKGTRRNDIELGFRMGASRR